MVLGKRNILRAKTKGRCAMTTPLLIALWISSVLTSMGLILFVIGVAAYYIGTMDD